MPSTSNKKPLTGWGRLAPVECTVRRPDSEETLRRSLGEPKTPTLLARGAGRSYGDAAHNSAGQTLETTDLNRILDFDAERGIIRCQAGALLSEVLDRIVPDGWFLPVTPGTKYVSLGGAVAFDVHGKNHHHVGSISRFVRNLDLLTANGDTIRCSQSENPSLFSATVSGMGLTGVITQVELQLERVQSAYISQRRIKAANLDDALELFDRHDPDYQYSVAWIDCLATGRSLGRGILMFGNHAENASLPIAVQRRPLYAKSRYQFSIPFDAPSGLLNPVTIRAFNSLYYARQSSRETRSIVDFDSYFYPLDSILKWNRLYGRRGFVQYQCVFPEATSREALIQVLDRCSGQGRASFLAVLKRMGPSDCGLLSFPQDGFTLSLDIPYRHRLPEFLAELDEVTLAFGGRVYLAKDAFLTPASFRSMYANYDQWREIKMATDPENRFSSAMSRRLNIPNP